MSVAIGLIGYGRIGTTLVERILGTDGMAVAFAYDRNAGAGSPPTTFPLVDDPAEFGRHDADLVIEAADSRAVADLVPEVLPRNDVLLLSTTALADEALAGRLEGIARGADTRLLVPHGAILGIDGIQDARPSLTGVEITTWKNPANIDFSASEQYEGADITEPTVLYDGPTRGLCPAFPRNVNSHATVALAGLGFDRTQSRLIGDPTRETADHHITVTAEGTEITIERSSEISGVTGGYTLESIWGTVERMVTDDEPLQLV